jgi:hypothetical protein
MKVYPVVSTFIEYPALRSLSLEQFLKDRDVQSCPASRMASIDEATEECTSGAQAAVSMDMQYAVKNTFIEFPASRNTSLEEFRKERDVMSCPASRMVSLEGELGLTDHGFASPLIDWPATRGPSMEDGYPAVWSNPLDAVLKDAMGKCDASTTDGDTAPATPCLSDDECEPSPDAPVLVSLTAGLGLWSVGSAGHEFGACKPCAFLSKEAGCQNGQNCTFCHLCPAGEGKRRKKDKLAYRKAMRAFHYQGNCTFGMY